MSRGRGYVTYLFLELLKAALLSMLTLLVREVARFLHGGCDGPVEEA